MNIDLTKGIDDTPLGFGKYANLTPRQVLYRDPSYILWMSDNLDDEKCTPDLVDDARDAMDEERGPVSENQRRSWQDDPQEDVASRMHRNNNRR